ncbi:transcriptional regulator [Streptomyces albofaciens JCM 4342]|uniref:winged helix-turn-helix transcriptional regulator n=1 Tax=Streptomyces albofaciens TaxID=66866 RepID=UPI00123BCE6C|nr:helix-turn-helix domain-containing protein [Streptomyces albofaciens]KAA6214672.1 transcriptional regulator [Streptomyces albofaciens JCM 4342]
MSRRKGPYECGLDAAVDVIGGKWKVLLLWQLAQGPQRFGELKRALPDISEKVLIQQLREMETDRIVHREVYHQVPLKVEYSLTGLGTSLNAALEPLGAWGLVHMEEIEATYGSRHPCAS